jgi:predicted dehydrogenase
MKVVVIGAGFGEYAMAPVYRKLGFEAEVVTPRDAAAVERALASKADLVSVHSPPFMHKDHVLRAIELGHNVLCDKPFGRNLDDARAMRERAREAGVLNFLNFETRHKPSRAGIKKVIDEGMIGRPLHMAWTFFSNGFRHGTHGWVNEREMGGGWISAYASHCIDLMRFFFGSEVAQCGGLSRIEVPIHKDREGVARTSDAEDAYSAWFILENGATATQDTSYCSAAPMPLNITVLGDAGGVELVGDNKLVVRRAPGDLSGVSAAERIRLGLLAGQGELVAEFPPAPGEAHEPALLPHLERIRDALRAGRQISPSFEDGVRVAEAMDMLKTKMVRAPGPK